MEGALVPVSEGTDSTMEAIRPASVGARFTSRGFVQRQGELIEHRWDSRRSATVQVPPAELLRTKRPRPSAAAAPCAPICASIAAQHELVNEGTSPKKMVETTTAVRTGPNTRACMRMNMSVMLHMRVCM